MLMLSLPVTAVVNAENTRVIFNADKNSVSLSLANSDKQPTLVQLWVDEGDMTVPPDMIKTPIIIPTPIFTMRPDEIRSIRLILASRTSLPKDRESLYWLNIYQIPPNTTATDNTFQKVILPLRIRMKIFVRPKDVNEIQEQDGYQLKFNIVNKKDNSVLLIENPTPWHLNLNQINLSGENIANMMLLPYSKNEIILQQKLNNSNQINFNIINDNGNNWQYKIDL